MATKSLADLINSGARKSVKRVSSYTQGNTRQVNLRNVKGRSDAGGSSAEMADFLGKTMEVGGYALDAHNKFANKENLETARQAKADYKNATPKQLQKYRDGERMGVFPLSENPYYEAELRRQEKQYEANVFGEEFSKDYTRWSLEKGPDEPRDFDSFVDSFMTKGGGAAQLGNESWQEKINNPGDDPKISSENFWPIADAVIQSKREHNIKKEEARFLHGSQDKLEQSRAKLLKDNELQDKTTDEIPIKDALHTEMAFNDEMNVIGDLIKGVTPSWVDSSKPENISGNNLTLSHTGEQVSEAFAFISGKKGEEVKGATKNIVEKKLKPKVPVKEEPDVKQYYSSGKGALVNVEPIVVPPTLASTIVANQEVKEDANIVTGANSLNNISHKVSNLAQKPRKRTKFRHPKKSERVVAKDTGEPPSLAAMDDTVETVKRRVQGVIGLGDDTKRFGEEEFKPALAAFIEEKGIQFAPDIEYGYDGKQLQVVHNPKGTAEAWKSIAEFMQQKWSIGFPVNSDNSSNKVLTDEEWR